MHNDCPRIIHKLISKEEQYLQDLDIVESVFIKPLRTSNPSLMRPDLLDDFIDDVFGNILDLRECNRRLLEVMYVRQREQAPIIQRIGDIFLDAATEFRLAYPTYIGHYPVAEKRLKDEIDNNPEFRLFLEVCYSAKRFTVIVDVSLCSIVQGSHLGREKLFVSISSTSSIVRLNICKSILFFWRPFSMKRQLGIPTLISWWRPLKRLKICNLLLSCALSSLQWAKALLENGNGTISSRLNFGNPFQKKRENDNRGHFTYLPLNFGLMRH